MDYEYSNLPLGLAMANLLDNRIDTGSHPLSEAEKEELIFQYKDAESKEEKERVKASFSFEDEIKDIVEGPGIG